MKGYEFRFKIPHIYKQLARTRKDYEDYSKYYFTNTHPNMKFLRVEGNEAVLVSRR